MPEQLGDNYKPSAQGKLSAGLAAAITGNIIYQASKVKPKPAQNAVKVPTSGNMPPRGAAPSATSAANFYSTRAKATVTAQSLENSYRLSAQAARGEGATGLVGAAQRVGRAAVGALRTVVGAGRWLIGGVSATTVALTTVTTSAILGVTEGILTQGTLTDTDELLALTRARYKQLGLTYVPDSPQSLNPPPFKGGQSVGVLYSVSWQITLDGVILYRGTNQAWGAIGGIRAGYASNGVWWIEIYSRGLRDSGNPSYPTPQEPSWYKSQNIGQAFGVERYKASITVVNRVDGLPDTGGDPPSEFGTSNSSLGNLLVNPNDKQIVVGEFASPPPTLISQPGDFLYDGARAPLQRLMDGTPPPWARNENPVARLPGARTVPSAPATPANIPQPDVAPSPNNDDKPINPYPFFDPVTFPDTATPNQFDIQPAFKPNPLTSNPLSPTTDAPSTTPSLTPASVPSNGTTFQPNPTTRNPEPAPKTETPVKTEPAPEKDPFEKMKDTFLPIATGIALITPLIRDISTNTKPEAIIPLVKEGTCQTTQPGGCTSNLVNNTVGNSNQNLKDWITNNIINSADALQGTDTNARVRDIQNKIGSDEYPMLLPEYLLDDHLDTQVLIPNQARYNEWLLKQIDALVGLFPIKIKRVDENGQEQTLVFENIAEAIAELTGLLAQIAFDADTAVNVSTRATGEALGAKAAALQAGSYLKAIIDHMGFQTQSVAIDVPVSVTLAATGLDGKLQESELKDFLKPSTQKVIGIKNTDPVDARLTWQRILQNTEIARAALYRPLKPNIAENTLTGDGIKTEKTEEKKRVDKQWEAFKLRMEGHTAGTKVDIDDGNQEQQP
ncbi:MAG: hypothetical protein ACRCZS_02485 [Chroococcidiopsis sp.]